jgi:hypothetical protein
VYAGSRTEAGVRWDDCCDVASKPAPSPITRVRHPEIQLGWFGWSGRVGRPPPFFGALVVSATKSTRRKEPTRSSNRTGPPAYFSIARSLFNLSTRSSTSGGRAFINMRRMCGPSSPSRNARSISGKKLTTRSASISYSLSTGDRNHQNRRENQIHNRGLAYISKWS